MIALYIILAISLIALVYLFIIVFRGGNKNSQSFQRELALRNAKKNSKKLAEDYVNGEITFEQLCERISNQNTIKRIETNTQKLTEAKTLVQKYNDEYAVLAKKILDLKEKLGQEKQNGNNEKVQELTNQILETKTKLAETIKMIKSQELIVKQAKYDLKLIISSYAYGAATGSKETKLTRTEKSEEKQVLKAAMKEKKAAWKAEDDAYFAQVKENIKVLKVQVEESKAKLALLKKAYLEEKKANQLAEKLAKQTKEEQPEVEPTPVVNEEVENTVENTSGINYAAFDVEEDDPKHVHEKEYREYLKEHERLVQKYRIEKDRISLTRKAERWSKRGGHLRREVFVKRQYYYLVAPYTILFTLFTVIPVLMSLALSFTYFNLLEFPTFNGWSNYMRLFVDDKVFTIALRNTAILAVITGPLSYIMAFVFAWLINELKPLLRSIMTLIFYAPSISGNVYLVWKLIFSSDIYGYANAILLELNIIKEPITWLQDAQYIIWILIIVQLWLSLGVSFLAFIAGLQSVNRELYEAGAIDGIKNRWQELWYITLPQMKSQLLFGAVMQITSSLSIAEVSTQIAGFPSIEYAGHTIITHLMDYGSIRMEMGYASAIATILFIIMIVANMLVRKILRRVGS